ncbi:peptidase E [Mycobacteroides abscessus subsp. massiliense]|uniref:Type 1 glutamine amidotransferase-like domain-containing protein n=1 Tax=Mycobacteroides abscessus TaxID=36809 RepID=UPI0009A73D6D|nr:peptidase E [Mycobacteroides abscessus subsp. massiliense]SLI16990.1 peptidase E [Mycobacteroides abscessus subsp. massiliense]
MDPLRRSTIVLLGGGFSDGQHDELDTFLLEQSNSACPKICFIPTASGDSQGYIERFHTAFSRRKCKASHLELFRRNESDIHAFVAEQDILYVGGGNTANLLAVWRLHDVDRAIRQAYRSGVVLAGVSAGAACWFESCLTDSFGALAPLRDGLGLLPGSFCPHYNTESRRAEVYPELIREGKLPPGYALDDGAAAKFTDGELDTVYKTEPTAGLYRI